MPKLDVIEAAQSHNLTTLSVVKDELEIAGGSEDARLSRWIAQASAAIYGYCSRVFIQEMVAETFDLKSCADKLVLSRFPVADIVSITEADVPLEAADYAFSADSGIVQRLSGGRESRWPPARIVVTYSAGYAFDDLPQDIQGAAIALVKQYRFSAMRDPQVRSESIDGAGSTSYFDGLGANGGLSPEVVGSLKHYVNHFVG